MPSTPSSFSSIPIIDVGPLFGGGAADQRRVADEMGRAASDIGFMYVSGAPVAQQTFDRMLAKAQEFFALPERKMDVYIGRSTNHRGYVPEGEEVFAGGTADKKEAFDLSIDLPADDPDYLALNPLLGPNQWPDLDGFVEAVDAYYRAVFEAGRGLMRGFAMALGLDPGHFEPNLTKPPSQLRLIHYPHDPDAVDRVGIGAHTDYECFTMLRGTAPGLEVLNGSGEWIDAPPVEGTFVVNIGDMLELLSNGQFVATTHRVRKVTEERYSFPLFFNVDYATVVAPLDTFVTAQRPARQAISAGAHLIAQTAQSFRYLRRRIDEGAMVLPDGALPLSSFGHRPSVAVPQ